MIELSPTDMANGGAAVARVDGKTHFVEGALPGERIEGEVVQDKGSWARIELRRVLEPSPQRVAPPCPHFVRCGGCQWQFADYRAQLEWKRSIVHGQLSHLGGHPDPPVRPTVAPGPEYGYRNRMDFRVWDGKPALFQRRSKTLVPLDVCMLLEPELAELFGRVGDLSGARGITLRASTTGGGTLAVIEGQLPDGIESWNCQVTHRSRHGLHTVIGSGAIVERVAGTEFTITGGAFFQNNTRGAEVLVKLVDEALRPMPHETLLDGFAGGGLFGGTVGRGAGRVIAIESSPRGAADLRHNLDAVGVAHRIIRGYFVETATKLDEHWDVAVVDPPREGLKEDGVEAATSARPRAIAYVSCDPASLARDLRHLAAAGYELVWAAPVDMFPQTFHVETVAAFVRSNEPDGGLS